MSQGTGAPFISIITPLYNRAWCIADCIASVGLQGRPVEMVIVDDGSTDASVAAGRAAAAALGVSDQVRIVQQADAGPGGGAQSRDQPGAGHVAGLPRQR